MFRPVFTAALLLAACVAAFAQQQAPPALSPAPAIGAVRPVTAAAPGQNIAAAATPGAPALAAAPAAPGANVPPAASAPPPAAPGAGPDNMVTLQYPNSDVADVLRLYETLTGKRLVMDNFVQGKVNIFLAKPVPRDEAIKIIEMNLLMNGYSLIPAEGDIVKVIGANQSPRTTGVPIISDAVDIPPGDHVVSFLFKLRYADPTELQQVLGQYLTPPKSYTSFLALPKAGAILVTENSSVIRVLARIIEQVDIPPAEVVSEFIKLQRADAQKVVDMLRDIFEKNQPQTGQPGAPGAVRPVRNPNIPAAPVPVPGQPGVPIEGDMSSLTVLSEEAVVVGKIRIAADVRTNRIHVITRPINIPFIRKLIGEFDANVEFAQPVTRPLRYVSAADMLPVLVQSLTEPGTGQQGGGEVANNPNQQQQVNPQRRNNTATTGGYSAGTSSDTTGGGGSLNVSEELSTQAVDTTPKAVTIGNAKIIADQRANAIIILGNREVVVKVMKILDQMDVSSPQVALSTVIGELTLSHNEEFGVDYFGRHARGVDVAATSNFTGFPPVAGTTGTTATSSATPSSVGGTVFDPANLARFTQLATSAASGANIYLAAGQTLAAVVHGLESTGNFKVISRPTVFTSNNKKAIIANGQEIPVPVSTLGYATGGTTNGVGSIAQQSNIQFKKIALQLEVVPLINSEKEVSLDILQKLDSIAGSTTIDGNSIPTIATRYIKTTVTAPNCATIVLGGLIQNSEQRNTTGVPVLSRIPVIGGLFRSTSKPTNRTELIVLMRPEVSLTKVDLARLRQKNEDKSHFGPELDHDDCPDCPPRVDDDKQVIPTSGKEAVPMLPEGSIDTGANTKQLKRGELPSPDLPEATLEQTPKPVRKTVSAKAKKQQITSSKAQVQPEQKAASPAKKQPPQETSG